VTDRRTADGRRFEPWKLRTGRPVDARRAELFALAAPVFRRHGYRGATIKALAHACGLSPASLYHYFGSKQELATYLLHRPRMDWDSTWVDPALEPLDQIALLVDLSIAELPNYLLALRLADEIGAVGGARPPARRAFREGESVFGRLVAAAAPRLARADALRIARDALAAMVGSAVMGLDVEPHQAVRDRVRMVLRTALVPDHVEAGRFEAAMAG
jgi:AcrR family transcriptional regulator